MSEPLKIVCFYPWPAFEPGGAWTRFTCLWRYLLEQGAHVTLAFFSKGKDAQVGTLSVSYISGVNLLGAVASHARGLLGPDSKAEFKQYSENELIFLLLYEKSATLSLVGVRESLDNLIRNSDLITCEYPMFAPLLSDFCRKYNKPLVVTAHDILYELHGIHAHGKQRLKEAEVASLALASARVYCNESEAEHFRTLGLPGVTVPNSGDAYAITPRIIDPTKSPLIAQAGIKASEYCLFVGSNHGPNSDAVLEIKRYAKTMPKLTFVVAGSVHAPHIDGNFIALGFISERLLEELYHGAMFVLIPLFRGTGMSIKTFQALAYGKSIISTVVGVRGYPVVHGEHALIAQTADQVPTYIKRVLAEPELRQTLSKNARALACDLDFRKQFQPYRQIIEQLVPGRLLKSGEPKSLILVDNTLKDTVGHHFNYALSLKLEAAERGYNFKALISQEADEIIRTSLSGRAVFGQGIHSAVDQNPFPKAWGTLHPQYELLHGAATFAREIEEGLADSTHFGDTVFIPNATPPQLLGLALLFQNSPLYRGIKFVALMRYSLYFVSGTGTSRKLSLDRLAVERYGIALNHLTNINQLLDFRLATDSHELAKEYAELFHLTFHVMPIPHTTEASNNRLEVKGVPLKLPGIPRIVFLGDAREEKGFELLPSVVRGVNRPCEFVFQSFVSSHYHERMYRTIDELRNLKRKNLHLIERNLNSAEYGALLSSADLVLTPYDAAVYRARTSGPFMEALCAGKPVVIPRHSWMSIVLGESQAGVTFNSGQPQDLVRAVNNALANLRVHTDAAIDLGRVLSAEHNPSNFIESLFGKS